jgi:CDP-diacylglycerol---glycerol-3-phosphate 3-phosphatidyltransferase
LFPLWRKVSTVDSESAEVYIRVAYPAHWRAFLIFSENEMNLPNSLTVLRIFFVPLLVVVLLTRQPNWNFWGLPFHFEVWGVLILLVAAATDAADGYIARKRREVTTLGILLDPVADKLLISAAFIALVQMHLVQAWMVVIIIGREFIVMGLREIASVEGLIIPATALGKTKMILQVVAGCAVILTANHPALKTLGVILLWLVVLSAVASAIHYFQMFWSQINFRVQERHRRSVMVVDAKEKPQDVLSR